MDPVRTFVRSAWRALAILGFVLVHVVTWLYGDAIRRLGRQSIEERRAWFAACVLSLFRALGATFIKLGQILSTRPDLLPPHLIAALEKLQDEVGAFPFSDVEVILSEEYRRPPGEIFAELSREPIASASVAQVHRARLLDGRVVAVKVRRPDIEDLVEFDLLVIGAFARALEVVPSIRLLAPAESVREFGRGIRMQLDFTVEARNNRRFRRHFAGDPDVLFPELVDELCTMRVLVMDFVEGVKIFRFRETTAEPKRLAATGFRVLLKMVFEDGFVHADLHPGNLLITPEGRIAILDVGLVGEMDTAARGAFARYFGAWVAGDGKTMAEIMFANSPSQRVPDYAGFEAAVVEFVRRYHGKRLGEVEVARVLLDMMGILRRYRVRANPTFTLVNIAIAVVEGIGKQLDPEVDLMAAAVPFFARLDPDGAAATQRG